MASRAVQGGGEIVRRISRCCACEIPFSTSTSRSSWPSTSSSPFVLQVNKSCRLQKRRSSGFRQCAHNQEVKHHYHWANNLSEGRIANGGVMEQLTALKQGRLSSGRILTFEAAWQDFPISGAAWLGDPGDNGLREPENPAKAKEGVRVIGRRGSIWDRASALRKLWPILKKVKMRRMIGWNRMKWRRCKWKMKRIIRKSLTGGARIPPLVPVRQSWARWWRWCRRPAIESNSVTSHLPS